MLPWSSRGFCGVTERTKGSSCGGSTDLKGSWEVSSPAGASFLSACLSRCVACSSCRYVSVSQKDNDCSWYRACSLETSLSGYTLGHRSYRVRHENGTTVRRVSSRLAKGGSAEVSTLESENVQVESLSSDAVYLGSACACPGPQRTPRAVDLAGGGVRCRRRFPWNVHTPVV